MNYLIFDTETAGLGLKVSLLTGYFLYTDRDLNIRKRLSLTVKPNDGLYVVQPEGLAVNGISLPVHDKFAVTYKEAGTQLYKFLEECVKDNYSEKLIPVGHRVHGDIAQIQDKLISIGSWEKFVSYREMDTMNIARYLQVKGKIPASVSCSLVSLVEHFKIDVVGEPHTAEYDAKATAEVFRHLLEIE